ncbi:MAG: DUF6891 domain-containing protein [Jatrophihabitans sp.]
MTATTPVVAPDEVPASRPDPDADRRWLHRYVRVQVRAGLFDLAALRELTLAAAASRFTDADLADENAREALSAELDDWLGDADSWVGRTDPERLDAALAVLADHGVLMVQAAGDEAELATTRRLRGGSRGTVGYVLAGVARAMREEVLPLWLVGPDGSPAVRGDALNSLVQDALAAEGLLAGGGAQPGELLVPMSWRRRPPRNLAPDS